MNVELYEYTDINARSPFAEWFSDLDPVTAARLDKYLRRMEAGNLGNSRPVGEGVSELKIDFGPGYRVYYGKHEHSIIILLGGGDKRRQSYDIEQAIRRWRDFKKTRRDQPWHS